MVFIVLASAFIPGFENTQSELFATVQLAVRLRNGVLEMPSGIKHLFVEVGIGEFYGFNATNDDPKEPRDPKAFLVGFDPMPRGRVGPGKRDRLYRSVVLPYALGLTSGMHALNVSRDPSCISFVAYDRKSERGRHCSDSNVNGETRMTDTITLAKALELTGGKDGLPIAGLKISTGVVGLDMIQATPPELLQRVMRLMVDAPASSCPRVYVGQPSCEMVLEHMLTLGFHGTCPSTTASWARCDEPALFVRKSAAKEFLPPLEWFESDAEADQKGAAKHKEHHPFWRKKTFYFGMFAGGLVALTSARRASGWLAVKLDEMLMRSDEKPGREYKGEVSYT